MARSTPTASGDVLGDRYVLRARAWTSLIGPVWEGRDRKLERPVFVQLLDPQIEAEHRAVRAFQNTASLVAQVSSPGIIQVLDIGDDPPFAVIEHASGGRLSDRLAGGRPIQIQEATRIALALARGLEAMHARGLWHGALSPESILIDAEGRAKLLAIGATESKAALGRSAEQPAGYRPPETAPIPADADRWALGALLYQMVTGRAPDPIPVPARQIRRSVPAPLDALLRRTLAADQTLRPTLDEFQGALAPFARAMPSDARTQRFAASEFRWLVPVIVIVALAIGALTVGVKVAADFAKRRNAEPSASPTTVDPKGDTLTIVDVRDFDPPPGNGEEHPDRVDLATDGDETTSWATVGYRSSNIGGKPGVGLLVDLGESRRIGGARIVTSFAGWEGEVRVADAEGERSTDYTSVATFTAQDESTITLPAGTTGRFVLVWITSVAKDNADAAFPWRATITELSFTA